MHITVYAASSAGLPEVYHTAAARLGTLLAQRGHTLVNGAGHSGLMGAAIDAAIAAGGRTVGVIPEFMIERGWHHTGMSELVITPDMHSRKAAMAARSQACIACPGGVGTLEELLEIITWRQLGLYPHPVVVLNTEEFYAPLLTQFAHCSAEGMLRATDMAQLWHVATTPEEAVRLCEQLGGQAE